MRWQEAACVISMSAAHKGENMEHSRTSIVEMEKTRFILKPEYNLGCFRKAITFHL